MITIQPTSNRHSRLAYRSLTARYQLGITIGRAAIRAGLDAEQYEKFEMGLPSEISHRQFHSQLLQLEWEAANGHPLP